MAVRAAPVASSLGAQPPSTLAASLRPVSALVGRHRRLLAALCLGAAAMVGVSALTASPPPAADRPGVASPALPAGVGDAPVGAAARVAVEVRLADPAGLLLLRVGAHAQVLAGPAADSPGVGSPAGAAEDPGLDGRSGGDAHVLAPDAVVLAIPQPPAAVDAGVASGEAGGSGLLAGGASGAAAGGAGLDGVVLLAVPPPDARRIASAAGSRPLSVTVAMP